MTDEERFSLLISVMERFPSTRPAISASRERDKAGEATRRAA